MRKLDAMLNGEGQVGAFADDTALVTEDISKRLKQIAKVFGSYGEVSGWRLSFGNTVIIPLWPEGGDAGSEGP